MPAKFAPRHAVPERPSGIRHARRRRTHRVLRGISLVTVAILAFGASAAYATYAMIYRNVNQADISGLLARAEQPRPTPSKTPEHGDDPNAGKPVNILLLGSDWRGGENGKIGGNVTGGMRSDTAIVMHVSADRSRVEMVSIPRDSMVKLPSCPTSNGKKTWAQDVDMFNNGFAYGYDTGHDLESAAACAWLTVETNTGVALDAFAVVDFAGFQHMVRALNGVHICIPQAIKDKKAHLDLPAGYQKLSGRDALAFARSRKNNLSDGSDLNRIGNQQRLVAAMAQEALSKNLLTDWTDLLGLLSAASRSLTTSMSVNDMAGLAYSMRSVRGGNITLMTIPVRTYPANHYRVEWTGEADTIWANMAADIPMLTGTSQEPAPATTVPAVDPSATAPATVEPVTPTPGSTKKAGREAFTLDDTTATC